MSDPEGYPPDSGSVDTPEIDHLKSLPDRADLGEEVYPAVWPHGGDYRCECGEEWPCPVGPAESQGHSKISAPERYKLQRDTSAESDAAYARDLVELQRAQAATLAQQRDTLPEDPGNVGNDGAPHYIVNADGVETCGSCGEEWPCARYSEIADKFTVSSPQRLG